MPTQAGLPPTTFPPGTPPPHVQHSPHAAPLHAPISPLSAAHRRYRSRTAAPRPGAAGGARV